MKNIQQLHMSDCRNSNYDYSYSTNLANAITIRIVENNNILTLYQSLSTIISITKQ